MVKSIEPVKTDDIITYKEENGVVYGYFNQIALDLALYNRARERTHNFADKDQWEDERSKRAVSLDDISIQRHSILFRPIIDGNYISEGDILLDLGLNWLSYGDYFRKNNISEYETWLSRGIRVFSSYSGYFHNKISDNIIRTVNLGNTIKDGDLLFTIRIAPKPEVFEYPVKRVCFTYNLLSRNFLESIPYLGDIQVFKWLVGGYTKVKEGDDILEVHPRNDVMWSWYIKK